MSSPRATRRTLSLLGRLVWSLLALAVLLGLVGGVPAALWMLVGWPLPHALPTLAELGRALTQNGIPDTVLIDILALGCWAAWAVFAAAIAVEAVAAVRGRAARRLPLPLAGPLQALAGALVAAVLLTFGPLAPRTHAHELPGGPLPAALAAAEPTEPALAQHDPGSNRPPTAAAEPPPATHRPAAAAAAPRAPRRYTVKPRDTLWGIADRELGDPFKWHDIYRRNKDRPQPDGRALTDPDLIRPGWTLELPAISSPPRRGAAQAPPPTGPRPAAHAAAPGAAHKPEREQPGHPTVTTTPKPTRPSTGSPPTHHGDNQPEAPCQPSGPAIELPSGAVVGGSLAAGIAVALAAARLHQRRRRRLGEPRPGITHTDPLVTPTVRRLRRAAHAADEAEADAAGHARDRDPARDPALDLPEDAAAATTRPTAPVTTRPAHPGTAAVRHAARQHPGEVAVDLTDGGLALVGPAATAAARAVLVALLASAQHQPDAVDLEVTVVGDQLAQDLLGGAIPVPGLVVAADLDAALSAGEVELVHRLRLLQDHEATDVAAYLAIDPAEPLPTLVLVADPARDTKGWEHRLAAVLAAGRRLRIGALLLGPVPGVATLTLGGDAEIQAVRPAAAADDADRALARLLGGRAFTLSAAEARELLAVVAAGRGTQTEAAPAATAAAAADATAPGAAAGPPPVAGARAQVQAAPGSHAAPDERPVRVWARVRLFGPLRIERDGAEVRTGLRSKAPELLAFLLLHPDGARRETAIEALWPELDPTRSAERAKDALRSLRQALRPADAPAGTSVVELVGGGDRWRVNAALVDCDAWRFQAALAAYQAATDNQAKIAALAQALAAYGGELLEGAGYDWAEEAREELRRQAGDVAGRLAELRERAGDLEGALAALEDGARVDACNEELHQRIMRLQARLGRLDAVRRTYTRLQARLADLGADPDEATERLFAELRRGSTAP